jgi:hypothetical protein
MILWICYIHKAHEKNLLDNLMENLEYKNTFIV